MLSFKVQKFILFPIVHTVQYLVLFILLLQNFNGKIRNFMTNQYLRINLRKISRLLFCHYSWNNKFAQPSNIIIHAMLFNSSMKNLLERGPVPLIARLTFVWHCGRSLKVYSIFSYIKNLSVNIVKSRVGAFTALPMLWLNTLF